MKMTVYDNAIMFGIKWLYINGSKTSTKQNYIKIT